MAFKKDEYLQFVIRNETFNLSKSDAQNDGQEKEKNWRLQRNSKRI